MNNLSHADGDYSAKRYAHVFGERAIRMIDSGNLDPFVAARLAFSFASQALQEAQESESTDALYDVARQIARKAAR